MALADRTITPAKKGRRRRVDELLELLGDNDRDALLGWLNDPAIGSKRIAAELDAEATERGDDRYRISSGAITNYRTEVLGVEVDA